VFPVNRSSLSRWKQGAAPVEANARLPRDLATVVAHLAEYYEPATIPRWLHGNNPDPGYRRPIDAIRAGEIPEVLSVIEAQTSGAFC
jgi:hypothetical protein